LPRGTCRRSVFLRSVIIGPHRSKGRTAEAISSDEALNDVGMRAGHSSNRLIKETCWPELVGRLRVEKHNRIGSHIRHSPVFEVI
jgi:hypothetical protein